MKKTTILLFAIIMACSFTSAADMSGTFKVGSTVGADYATLSVAVNAINAATITGNIVLEITSNITEPTNFGLAKDFGTFSLTIRPDADADRTITFTQATANAGPYGHFVIGCATGNLGTALADGTVVATNNVTIDGYAVGGTTKRLNFITPAEALAGSAIVNIVGGCSNTTIRNCIFNNRSSGSSPKSIYIVQFKGTTLDVSPTNTLITNNQITTNNNTVSGYGIQCNRSGSATTRITGLQITNNLITASGECIEVYYCNGVNITGNEIKVQKGTNIGSGIGVWLRGSAGDMNVIGNKFTELSSIQTGTGTYATQGILTGATSSNPFNVNIINNTFSGMNRSVSGPTALNQSYIAEVGFGTTKIYNNSFYLPALSQPTQAGAYNAISFTTTNYKADIQNNIFISNEDAKSILISKPVATGFTSNNNVFFLRAGNTNAKIVDTYATLTAYQTANPTLDVNSKSVDVNFVDASTGNLLLTGASIQNINLKVPSLLLVTTDILGKTRDASFTYAGAQESDLPFLSTGIDKAQITTQIKHTNAGIEILVNEKSTIELYTLNGILIEKALVNDTYNRALNNGIYIININGKVTKFVK